MSVSFKIKHNTWGVQFESCNTFLCCYKHEFIFSKNIYSNISWSEKKLFHNMRGHAVLKKAIMKSVSTWDKSSSNNKNVNFVNPPWNANVLDVLDQTFSLVYQGSAFVSGIFIYGGKGQRKSKTKKGCILEDLIYIGTYSRNGNDDINSKPNPFDQRKLSVAA